ncbi:MAG: hypothetical protein [Siphoviridae sp. ctpQM7]|nr:MAG: hypothetical protein [Siphoviridae sp. ctpQM7]
MVDNEYLIRGYIAEACTALAPGDRRCECVNAEIMRHDSLFATAGVGKKLLNPANIRCIKPEDSVVPVSCVPSPQNGSFSSFKTLRDGTYAGVALYVKKYAGRHHESIVRIWAGNPQSKGYWEGVRSCFLPNPLAK